jgi:hypothetical protein
MPLLGLIRLRRVDEAKTVIDRLYAMKEDTKAVMLERAFVNWTGMKIEKQRANKFI